MQANTAGKRAYSQEAGLPATSIGEKEIVLDTNMARTEDMPNIGKTGAYAICLSFVFWSTNAASSVAT